MQSETQDQKRIPPGLILLAAVCLALPTAFITLHLTTPSDGARLSDGESMLVSQGAVIIPYHEQPGGLKNGDVVTAVDGRPMEAIARSLLRGDLARPAWAFGQTVTYSVLRDGRQLELPVTLGRLPLGAILSRTWGAILFALVSQLVALFVLLKKPRDPAARALFIWAMSGSHTYTWSFFLQISDLTGGVGFWLFNLATPGLWLVYWPAAVHVGLVFPKPLPAVRRWPQLLIAPYVLSFALFAGLVSWSSTQSSNSLEWIGSWGTAGNLIVAVFFLSVNLAVITMQYRRQKTPQEKDQIRLAIYGAALSIAAGVISWGVLPLFTDRDLVSPNLQGLLALPFPLTLALAIWRHQLFDIDLIINRTLVYTLLSTLLAGVYFSGVVLLQLVFSAQTQVSIVLSTLAIAALFSPLRNRVQAFIDRRFYRRKYDAEQALASFSGKVREEVDLGMLEASLTAIIKETIQPQHVSLWLAEHREE